MAARRATSDRSKAISKRAQKPKPARTARPGKPPRDDGGNSIRLQKVLAAAGLGSRRQCEQLILEGRVEVDRRVVTELGTRVRADEQDIRVDGESLPKRRRVYYLLNKPPGVVSTNRDPAGRTRVIDLLPDEDRLFTVGRLDMSSEGLILVTNDGELANRLAHPRFGIEKTYRVYVAGTPTSDDLKSLRRGIHLAEATVRVENIRIKRRLKRGTMLEMVLAEGRNREIRRMLARLGHRVHRLQRIALGPLRLGELPKGSYRELTSRELKALRSASAGTSATSHRSQGTKRSPDAAASKTKRGSARNAAKPAAGTGRSKPASRPKRSPADGAAKRGKPKTRASKTTVRGRPMKKKP